MKLFLHIFIYCLISPVLTVPKLITHAILKSPNHSQSPIDLLELLNHKNTSQNPKKGRKLMLPVIVKLLESMQKLWENHIHMTTTFNEVSGGKTSIVLPRDAPTVVVNQMPMQAFRLSSNPTPNPNFQKNLFYRILVENSTPEKYGFGKIVV